MRVGGVSTFFEKPTQGLSKDTRNELPAWDTKPWIPSLPDDASSLRLAIFSIAGSVWRAG